MRHVLAPTGILLAGLLTGCSAFQPHPTHAAKASETQVRTVAYAPARQRPMPRYTILGASDSLGTLIFTKPAAVARAQELRREYVLVNGLDLDRNPLEADSGSRYTTVIEDGPSPD